MIGTLKRSKVEDFDSRLIRFPYRLTLFVFGFLACFPIFLNSSLAPKPIPIGFVAAMATSVLFLAVSKFEVRKEFLYVVLGFFFLYAASISIIFVFFHGGAVLVPVLEVGRFFLPILFSILVFNLAKTHAQVMATLKGIYFSGAVSCVIFLFLVSRYGFEAKGFHFGSNGIIFGYQGAQYVAHVLASGFIFGFVIFSFGGRTLAFILASLAYIAAIPAMTSSSAILVLYANLGAGILILSRNIVRANFIVIALGGTVLLILSTLVVDLSSHLGRFDDMGGRLNIWQDVLNLVHRKPLFGFAFSPPDNLNDIPGSHNEALHVLIYAGVVGLIFYIIFNCYLLSCLLSGIFRAYRGLLSPMSFGLAVCAACLGLASLITIPLFQPYSASVFWVVIGLFFRCLDLEGRLGVRCDSAIPVGV